MKKYLLSKMQKIAVLAVALSYVSYLLFDASSYALSPEQFFRPYSKIFFVLCIALALVFMKRNNWKSKIKLLTLATTLVFIFYTTSLQLQYFFESGNRYLDFELAKNTAGDLKFENIEKMSSWIKNEIHFQIFYRIGKIILLDLFAIFAFFAINKTINELEETKE